MHATNKKKYADRTSYDFFHREREASGAHNQWSIQIRTRIWEEFKAPKPLTSDNNDCFIGRMLTYGKNIEFMICLIQIKQIDLLIFH